METHDDIITPESLFTLCSEYRSYCLQKDIIRTLDLIIDYEKYILECLQKGQIVLLKYQLYMKKLQNVTQIIRKKYNEITLNELNKDYKLVLSTYILNLLIDNKYETILNISKEYKLKLNKGDNILLSEEWTSPISSYELWKKEIFDIIKNIGYNNIKNILRLLEVPDNRWNNSKLYNLLESNFIIYKINISNDISIEKKNLEIINCNPEYMSTDFYLIDVESKDVYELYELRIKIMQNKWLHLEGYIIDLPLRTYCNMNSKVLGDEIYNKRRKLLEYIDTLELSEGILFKKNIIKTSSVGDLLVKSFKQWIKYLDDNWKLYSKLNNMPTDRIIADFLQYTEYKKMFNTIKILMAGSKDHGNLACILYHMMKNKKNHIFCDKVFNKLAFEYQLNLIESQNILKKDISNTQIDWKKIVIQDDKIPIYVKNMLYEKIEEMNMMNNDYYKQYIYVKTLINFPWSEDSHDMFKCFGDVNKSNNLITDINNKLNEFTYSHHRVKEQILLQIGKWISNPNGRGNVIALQGPPGVGKTLIAKSLASALDMPMIHITLGGQNDASLLHGHCYTYSAAQPGIIIKKISELGTTRCVLLLDELDKTTNKHNEVNEISSVLIHLTDSNSNQSFQDRFFDGVDFPLDKLIIIASYNNKDKIDPILLDRFIEIQVKPYTISEKIEIVKKFIIPELVNQIGIRSGINISDQQIRMIINDYTLEPGVRNLKRKIEQILLKINFEIVSGKRKELVQINIVDDEIIKYINDKKITKEQIHEKSTIGVVNGLYATTGGYGGIIPIQIKPNCFPNGVDKFHFKLTGHQGDVMKESVTCAFASAMDYLSKQNQKIIKEVNEKYPWGFHVHTPSGGTPKDGPSAGCAFVLGFISSILMKEIRNDIAMTGEIDIQGNVTKIGGLIYKLYGAKDAGVKIVLISKENEDDVLEISKSHPDLFTDKFECKLIKNVEELVCYGLKN